MFLRVFVFAAACILACGTVAAAQNQGVAGTVTADGSKLPIAGVRVLIAASGTETRTAPDGTYRLAVAAAGTHTLVFLRDGFTTRTEQASVAAGQTLTLDIVLTASTSLTQDATVLGRVSDYTEATAGARRHGGAS